MLTDRLCRLEADGLVFRDYEPRIPPKVTYGLTDRGRDLDEALCVLERVAERWDAPGGPLTPSPARPP